MCGSGRVGCGICGVVCAARDRRGGGICGVVFGIRYARGAYAGSMIGWVSVAAGDGMRVAVCMGGYECGYFRSIWRRRGIE